MTIEEDGPETFGGDPDARARDPGLLRVQPQGGKVGRAAAVSPLIEAGNIYLPHPLYAPWVNDFMEECAAFPNGAHDDQVDAMTQALLRWHMAVGLELPLHSYLHEAPDLFHSGACVVHRQ